MPDEILINGETAEAVPFQDRGFHYGDGLFETIAVKNGQLLCWQAHIDRLLDSCNHIGIKFNDTQLLAEEAQQLANNKERAVIKLVITRGESGRGYAPDTQSTPNRIVASYPWPKFPAEKINKGIAVRLCQTRYGHNPQLAGMKHLNRLEQVIARSEWTDTHYSEGVVLDIEDNVIEGTMSNLFYVRKGQLYTPDLTQCGINGVIRRKIIDSIPNVQVQQTKLDDLKTADEIFFCNSVIGLWPVTEFDEQVFEIGAVSQEIKQMLVEQECIVE